MNVQLLPDVIAAYVADHYPVAPPVTAALLRRGFNDTYSIHAADGEKYVFRLYFNDKYYISGPDDFRFELDLLTYLHEHGCSVAPPLPRNDGTLLSTVPTEAGDRYGALFVHIEGAEGITPDATQAAALGEALARIHTVADGFTSPYPRYRFDLCYIAEEPLAHIRAAFARVGREAEVEEAAQAAESLMARIRGASWEGSRFGIVHGDPHAGNVRFRSDGVPVFFDFDHGGYGYRAWDLGTLRRHGSLSGEIWDAFFDAYRNIRPVSPEEEALIPIFQAFRPLWDRGDILAMATAWGEAEEPPSDERLVWIGKALEAAVKAASEQT
jgi:Ser/Thr protein kinase RdoA (MazF antagonist)